MLQNTVETRVEIQYSANKCEQCGGTLNGTTCSRCGVDYVVTRTSRTVRKAEGEACEQLMSFGDATIAVNNILLELEPHLEERVGYVTRQRRAQALETEKADNAARDKLFLRSIQSLTTIMTLIGISGSLAVSALDHSPEAPLNPAFAILLTLGFLSAIAAAASFHNSDTILEKVYYRDQPDLQEILRSQMESITKDAFLIEATRLHSFYVDQLYQYWKAFTEEFSIHEPEVAKKLAIIFKAQQSNLLRMGHVQGIEDLLAWCEQQLSEYVAPVIETA